MRLLEFEAKRMLASHGISVPAGTLWPRVPAGVSRVVLKAQIPEGRRAKRGGVAFADSPEDAAAIAERMIGMDLGGHRVEQVYVEERLEIQSELYLSVFVDRDARGYALLASRRGGIDVESVPKAEIFKVSVDPLTGLRPFTVRRLLTFLQIPAALRERAAAAITQLYATAVAEDAELVEVNPLVITADGLVVAGDAKMIVDGNASFRHPGWRELTLADEGSPVERAVAAAGGTAVEIDPQGRLVGVVSGAGLMMATLDLFVAEDARVRCMVDLGGAALADPRGIVPIFSAMARLRPDVLFVNAYFQTVLADGFAQAIVDAHRAVTLPGRVVVRLKGRNGDAAKAILAPLGFEIVEELGDGIRAAARALAGSGEVP